MITHLNVIYYQPYHPDIPEGDLFWSHPGEPVEADIVRLYKDGTADLLVNNGNRITINRAPLGTGPGCWRLI